MEGPARDLARLVGHLPARRRKQAFGVLFWVVLSAAVELLTLASVLAFLTAVASSGRASPSVGGGLVLAIVGPSNAEHTLLILAGVFGGFAILAAVTRILVNRAIHRFAFAVGADLGTAVYSRALSQPYREHLSQNSSEVLAGLTKAQLFIWQSLIPIISGLSSALIGAAIFAGLLSLIPGVAILCGPALLLAYWSISTLTKGALGRNSEVIAKGQTDRIQLARESLGGIRDVITGALQPAYVEVFDALERRLRSAQASNAFLTTMPRYVIEAAAMVLIAIATVALTRSEHNVLDVLPVLGAALFSAQKLLPLVQQVFNGWAQLSASGQSVRDLLTLLDRQAEHAPTLADADTIPFERAITLTGVSFRYAPDRPAVLEHIDLTLAKGAKIGLMGATGSGKSTLLDLITGLLEPTSGIIRIDDEALTPSRLTAWRKHIAYVSQHTFLADASIAENIAFGAAKGQIDQTRLEQAAEVAGVSAFAGALPQGYATLVGERGARLSGGQRQRLGIARAIYRHAAVLVFDEATSALDEETEADILRSIRGLSLSVTVIMVAHRQSSLAGCDTIWRLTGGSLVAAGSI